MEQPINRSFRLRAGYIQNESSGLVILNKIGPDPLTGIGVYQLSGSGSSLYRQFEVTASLRLKETSQLFFSYVRSSAQGNLNDFANFLGTFPVPLLRPDLYSTLPTDLPYRFLVWGNLQLSHGFRVAPVLESRDDRLSPRRRRRHVLAHRSQVSRIEGPRRCGGSRAHSVCDGISRL